MKIGVLVSGGGTNLQALLDAQSQNRLGGGEIVCVIASKAGVYALERAKKAGVEALVISKKDYESTKAYNRAMADYLKSKGVELVVLAGFLSILETEFLKEFPNRVINIHPSLIPSFCGSGFYGLKVHESALEYGVKVTGATVHFVSEVVDGGRIIMQKAVEIQEGDTPEVLQKRVMEEAEWKILPESVAKICSGALKK